MHSITHLHFPVLALLGYLVAEFVMFWSPEPIALVSPLASACRLPVVKCRSILDSILTLSFISQGLMVVHTQHFTFISMAVTFEFLFYSAQHIELWQNPNLSSFIDCIIRSALGKACADCDFESSWKVTLFSSLV